MAPVAWLAETRRTYLGNATSQRDFRVQMRGSKPFWIFSIYVVVLCIFGFALYASIVSNSMVSLAGAQAQLGMFFNSLMALLAIAICVFSPALTATAIVAERQRQSLDLVLSAPVEPKYLLVGKIISSYRYTWMLLILALPVVAMSVVLGGATWQDVFGCFLLLSFHALIFTSLALLISTVTARPASAVIWSVFGVGLYNIVAGVLAVSSAVPMAMRGSGAHVPFVIAMSPFTVLQAIQTTTPIGHYDVPNWVFAGIVSVLLSRLFLLGAAVNLAPLDRRLSANLRITGLILTFAMAALLVNASMPVVRMTTAGMAGVAPANIDSMTLNLGVICVSWLLLMMPLLACSGRDASRRYWPNGLFSVRHMLDGTPSGALPYAWALVSAAVAGAICALHWFTTESLKGTIYPAILWPIGLVTLLWAAARLVSGLSRTLKAARLLTFLAILLVTLVLPAGLALLQLFPPWATNLEYGQNKSSLWYLWVFMPVAFPEGFAYAPVYGLVMLAVAAGVAYAAGRINDKQLVVADNA